MARFGPSLSFTVLQTPAMEAGDCAPNFFAVTNLGQETHQSRFLGRGCDEALFSEKKGFSVKRGEAIQ